MHRVNWQDKFPEMTPVEKPPSMVTINGCGFVLFGARDHDDQTDTCVKTRCFCLLFVPVLAVGAYRVGRAPQGGWYFVGREPLSVLAKAWNLLLLLGILGAGTAAGWRAYTSSPNYRADLALAEAERLERSKQYAEAAERYRSVAVGPSDRTHRAVAKLKALVDGPLDQVSAQEAAGVLHAAADLQERGQWAATPDAILQRGLDLAKKRSEQDLRGALALIDAVAPLAPQPETVRAARRPLLERLVAAEPSNPEPAVQLAEMLERDRDFTKCEAVLEPHRGRLGDGEGARVLGQIDARNGRVDQAYALLSSYTKSRLQRLQETESAWRKARQTVQEQVIGELKDGHAQGFDYDAFRRAAKADQQILLQRYLDERFKTDPALKRYDERLAKDAGVVPVALDLGMVLLQRAQKETDSNARKAGLEEAEKTFLAVRGIAGGSDEYRLDLGQVYYWLGKHAEGRKLFEDLLSAKNRDFKTLAAVSSALREVGASTEAFRLAEEVYDKSTDPSQKQMIAQFLASTSVDSDERVRWLERADPGDASAQAMLAAARGQKAITEGNNEEAVAQLTKAISLYDQLNVDAAALNNGALARFELFSLTGERGYYEKAVAMMDKAVTLAPGDSILLGNAAQHILEGALRDIIADSLDLPLLKTDASIELLGYLYRDTSGRDQLRERVRTHAGVARAVSLFEKQILLAPKSDRAYAGLKSIAVFLNDDARLRDLSRKLEDVALDPGQRASLTLDFYAGRADEKFRKQLGSALARAEAAYHAARKGRKGATLAVAANQLANLKLSGPRIGLPEAADQVLALCEEAHAAAPSEATKNMLINALLHRAGRAVAQDDPGLAELIRRSQRELDPGLLLVARMIQGAPVRTKGLAHPDVKWAISLMREIAAASPDALGTSEWALLVASQPEPFSAAARQALGTDFSQREYMIASQLEPWNLVPALNVWWRAGLLGAQADGALALERCAQRGLPLPFDPRRDTGSSPPSS